MPRIGLGLHLGVRTLSGAAFTPSDLPGVEYWFDSSFGITKDGSDRVSSWADVTGNHTITQGTASNQPLFNSANFNGLPSLNFVGTGTGDFLEKLGFTATENQANVWLFVIYKRTSSATGYVITNESTTAGNGVCALRTTTSGIDSFITNQTGTLIANVVELSTNDGTPKLAGHYTDPADATGQIKTVETDGTITKHIESFSNTLAAPDVENLTIGRFNSTFTTVNYTGDLAEAFGGQGLLTDEIVSQIHDYAVSKYGVS